MPAGRVATLDRRFIQDPNAFYRALAVRDPAHSAQLWGGLGAWLVAGDAEARAMLTGPRLTKTPTSSRHCFHLGPIHYSSVRHWPVWKQRPRSVAYLAGSIRAHCKKDSPRGTAPAF